MTNTQSWDANRPPWVLRALRSLPSFKGKYRLARRLLVKRQLNRCTLILDRDGNQMVLPNLRETIGFSLAIDGSYEPELVDLLRPHLSCHTDFVDVGANIGSFTLALAGYARRVLAVEASPAVLPYLRRNIELCQFTNVEVVECAASQDIGTIPFYVPPMEQFGMGSSAAQFKCMPLMIRARPLDQILSEYGEYRVGAVKVDVEGFEAHVFLGAIDLIRSSSPLIVFEFCDWAEERAFPGRKGWAQQILLDEGYSLWTLQDYKKKLAPLRGPITAGFHSMVAAKSTAS